MLITKENIKSKRADAVREEKAAIALLQAQCEHLRVGHWDGNFGTSLTFPKRVCLDCALVEEGSWWSYGGEFWSEKNFGKARLDNGPDRVVTHLTFDEFCKERL
jgi:hypothetical protein